MWVTINGLISKTKQAAIKVLLSSGIQAEERRGKKNHRQQSGKIKTNKFYSAGYTEHNFERAFCSNGFRSGVRSHM